MEKLEDIRKRINAIDAQIADLFEQRMKECARVSEYKRANGLPVSSPAREAEVLKNNSALIKDDVLREYYINFQKNFMALASDYETRLMDGIKVAYAGVPGAFGHIAAQRLYDNAEFYAYPDFESAYNACSRGDCDVAVLPLENSFAGDVSTVTDLMFSGDLYVNQTIDMCVGQNLLACKGADLKTIRTVYSHPQALSQCAAFIKEHGYEVVEYPNTAEAAQAVAGMNDPSVAAIASQEAAERYGLEVLEARINASNTNTTRFGAFSRSLDTSKCPSKMGRYFMLMFTVKNEAGALAKTLNIIGAHNFNMSNLHSRPMKTLMWNYYFYMEVEGDIFTHSGQEMLRELGTLCDRLKLVGSFSKKL